jgi:hypothetical protein
LKQGLMHLCIVSFFRTTCNYCNFSTTQVAYFAFLAGFQAPVDVASMVAIGVSHNPNPRTSTRWASIRTSYWLKHRSGLCGSSSFLAPSPNFTISICFFLSSVFHPSLPYHSARIPSYALTSHDTTVAMPRQRGGSAGRAPSRPTVASRPAPAPAQQQTRPATTMAAPPQAHPQAGAPTSQGPGLFGQMASTAAYVLILLPTNIARVTADLSFLAKCQVLSRVLSALTNTADYAAASLSARPSATPSAASSAAAPALRLPRPAPSHPRPRPRPPRATTPGATTARAQRSSSPSAWTSKVATCRSAGGIWTSWFVAHLQSVYLVIEANNFFFPVAESLPGRRQPVLDFRRSRWVGV